MKSIIRLIPLALLFLCFSTNTEAQCTYNIGEPNETCSQTSSTWPISTSPNYIVGCVKPFDRDYYKLSVAGLTFYVQVRGSYWNITQGNYLLKMWRVGNVLHLKTSAWFINGTSDTKLKVYNSNCYSLGSASGVNTNYLTYDFTYDLRIAPPAGDGDIAMDVTMMRVAEDEIIPTFAPEEANNLPLLKSILNGDMATRHRVYPNPSNDQFTLEFADIQSSTQATLFDLSGKAIREVSLNNSLKTTIQVGDLTPGIYMLKIENALGVQNEKIVVR